MSYLADRLLERKISQSWEAFMRTRSYDAWKEFADLCKQRSPQQIARMEAQKGLV